MEKSQAKTLLENGGAMLEGEEKVGNGQLAAVKRIGIIGFGHLGQFLKAELSKCKHFELVKIWNRTEDTKEGVVGLGELSAGNLAGLDLVIEVAHPDVIRDHANTILKYSDLFIGSSNALADQQTYEQIQECLNLYADRSVFVPSGALWGAKDIRKMADLGTLKSLTVMMMKPPGAFRLPQLVPESPPELVTLHKLCEDARSTNQPKVLYDGPVRQICALASENVNAMACAAVAAHNLGFDNTRAKLIVDPALQNWHIVECEIAGENGFRTRTTVRRENSAQPGAMVAGEHTFLSFLSSVKEAHYKSPGFNIC